jgi:hypothetical protein
MSLGFQLKHKATCRGGGCLIPNPDDLRVFMRCGATSGNWYRRG